MAAAAAAKQAVEEMKMVDVTAASTKVDGRVRGHTALHDDIEIDIESTRVGEPVGTISVLASALHGTVIDGDEVEIAMDEIPVLAVAAAFAEGVTDIRDAAELRVKESDRIGSVHQELGQLGIAVESRPDGLMIRGGRP